MAEILGNSAVVAVRTRPLAILLDTITMRKSIHVFPFPSYIDMVLCFAARRAQP